MRKVNKTDLIDQLVFDMKNRQKVLEKFSERFTKDAADALNWSDDAFKAAAQYAIAKIVVDALVEHKMELSDVVMRMFDKMINGAKWPQQSTSAASNYMKICETQAYTEMWEMLSKIELVLE